MNKEEDLKKRLEIRCYIAPRGQLTGLGTSRCYLLSRMFTWRGVQARYFTSVMSSSTVQCTVAHQAPLSMGFSRQEYWSGFPCPPPGDHPDPDIEPGPLCLLHWQVGSLPLVPPERKRTRLLSHSL